MADDLKTQHYKNWLQRIQEQSWEPEILISGIVLFSLFQIPPYIEQANEYLNLYSVLMFTRGNVDEVLAAVLLTANYWLIFGFATHLMGRSIWAAFVGLSYVYVDGVNMDRLKYPKKYLNLIQKTADYKRLIVRLERFCSTVFAASFLLFMCTLGIFCFICFIGLLLTIIAEFNPKMEGVSHFMNPIITGLVFVYLVDFVGLGIIKRIPFINRIYYPVYRVMSIITLSPLYRSIYYGFVSNHNPWKVAAAMMVFFAGTVATIEAIQHDVDLFDTSELIIDDDENLISPIHYSNLGEGDASVRMVIESDIIDRNVVKVLLVHGAQYEDDQILKQCGFEEALKDGSVNKDSLALECLKNFYILTLDGQFIHPDFFYTYDRTVQRKGLLAYIDLAILDRGMHEFKLYYKLEKEDGIDTSLVSDIEFFKNALPIYHLNESAILVKEINDSLNVN
ncbi:MAG: hypothetical protein MK086_10285 [Flavobacteriales bacterium]|nr:hypothetical protein [Flavobacteriales bacterium]